MCSVYSVCSGNGNTGSFLLFGQDNALPTGFNSQAFLKKRSRATNEPIESMSMVCLQSLFTLFFLLFGVFMLA